MTENTETAILAGGCFWGLEELLRSKDGVISTRVGYTGGDVPNATYGNHEGHAEAVEIGQELELRQASSVTLFRTDDPAEVVVKATAIARPLADVINKQRLFKKIGNKNHVLVEGWTLLGSMLGVVPVVIWTKQLEHGWEARVEARTLAGHALLTLWLEADQPDAALHAYLEDVEPDGRCRYVTEGLLRALHRKTAPCPVYHRTSWPWRTFARADAAILPTGEAVELTFALLPVAWTFATGHRVRLAIAGADCDHVVQVPHGRPPTLRIHHGRVHPSRLVLPCLETGSAGARG